MSYWPRTPSDNSRASEVTAASPLSKSGASRIALTNAEPTITPSAYRATSLACSRVDTPRPTAIGRSVTARVRATSASAPLET